MRYFTQTPLEWIKEVTGESYKMHDTPIISFSSNKQKAIYNKHQKKLKKSKKKALRNFLNRSRVGIHCFGISDD